MGVQELRIVDKAWLRDNEPNLNPKFLPPLCPDCRDNQPLTGWSMLFARMPLRMGWRSTPRLKLKILFLPGPGFEIQSAKGTFKARYVINASGLFADEISAMLGVNDFKITPRKGQEFILDKRRKT